MTNNQDQQAIERFRSALAISNEKVVEVSVEALESRVLFERAIAKREMVEEIEKLKGREYVLDGNDFGFIADEALSQLQDSLSKSDKSK